MPERSPYEEGRQDAQIVYGTYRNLGTWPPDADPLDEELAYQQKLADSGDPAAIANVAYLQGYMDQSETQG